MNICIYVSEVSVLLEAAYMCYAYASIGKHHSTSHKQHSRRLAPWCRVHQQWHHCMKLKQHLIQWHWQKMVSTLQMTFSNWSSWMKIVPKSAVNNKPAMVNRMAWSQIARFTCPTWGLSGSCRPQVGPMWAPWTLLSEVSNRQQAITGQPITKLPDAYMHHSAMMGRRTSLIARFMGPAWGPPGDDRTQVDPMLAPWTLLSGLMPGQIMK